MLNMYIGSLKVHDSVNATNLWLEPPIEGLETPDIRMTAYDKPGEDGAVVSSTFYGSRPVVLHGTVRGANPAEFETTRLALTAACALQKDINGFPTATRITFTTLANNTYYVDVYFRKTVFNYDNINWAKFMIEAVAPGPFVFSSTSTSTIINRAIGGGAIVPFIVPVILAPGSGGTGSVTNNGNATAYPIITLTGPLTSPYIANAAAGKFMQLNYTLSSVDVITINMQQKTITLNGTSSLLSTKTVDSDWWGLLPGVNALTFSTGSAADTGYATIAFNAAYIGV